MAETNIEWADATWNPVVGCTPVSAGCANCYAATMARRLEGMGKAGYEERGGLRIAEVRGGRAVFTGSVRCLDDRIAEPLRWRKPRRIFVCSMSDVFHESVPFEFVHWIWDTMKKSQHHQYIVLTKRPARMAEIVTRIYRMEARGHALGFWSHVWLGTSIEDQRAADERIPHLLRCPAAVRFLSVEPLLGPVDLADWMSGINWVIVGGESGPKARPCEVAWIRGVVRQCDAAGVPCFAKQLGARPIVHHEEAVRIEAVGGRVEWDDSGERISARVLLRDRKGGDPSEWPEDLRVRQWPREDADRG